MMCMVNGFILGNKISLNNFKRFFINYLSFTIRALFWFFDPSNPFIFTFLAFVITHVINIYYDNNIRKFKNVDNLIKNENTTRSQKLWWYSLKSLIRVFVNVINIAYIIKL